jgi:hypothetical protein
MKMEQKQCSETSAIKHHTPGNKLNDYATVMMILLSSYNFPLFSLNIICTFPWVNILKSSKESSNWKKISLEVRVISFPVGSQTSRSARFLVDRLQTSVSPVYLSNFSFPLSATLTLYRRIRFSLK